MKLELNKTWKLFFIVLAIALLLRSYKLNEKEQGTDEKWTFIMTEQILDGTFLQEAGSRAHVPFFYALLAPFWLLSNKSVMVLRILVVLFGLISIVLTFILAKRIFNEKIALLSSFLLAFSPFHLMYSQHLRAYIFIMILFLISILLVIKYIETKNSKLFIPLTITYIIAFYSHLFAAFFIISQFITLFALKFLKLKEINLKPIIISGIITFISWLFWIPIFIKQFQFNIIEGGIKTISTLNPIHVPYTFYKYAVAMDFSYAVKNHIYVIILALILVLLVLYSFYKIFKESKRYFIILFGSLFLPVLLLAFIGIFFPVYSFRYFSYLIPIFMLALAKGINDIKNKSLKYTLLALTLIIWLIILKVYWSVFTQFKWGYEFAI
ncbi:MAG: glycosyltransferase family 39 protein [Nanoarchaeota archaeon]